MNKNQEGITLIALVITIIVLLILAGVSIAMLTGQNGILMQAENSKEQTEDSKNWEQVKLAVTTGKLENITNGTDINTAIQNELRKTDSAATVTGETDEKEITYFGKVYNVNVETGATSGGEDAFQKPDYNEAMLSLKQKDYVLYDTGKAEVGENGKILCQVLYEASSPYGLQIIPVDCIKENGEYMRFSPISDELYEYPRFSDEEINFAISEYNSAIQTLNEKALEFYNSDYILDARCVGSNPINKNSENTYTTVKIGMDNSEELVDTKIKDEDNNYIADYEELEKLNLLHTNASTTSDNIGYWLASRYNDEGLVYSIYPGLRFKLRTVDYEEYEAPGNEGSYNSDYILGIYYTGATWTSTFKYLFFRPVFLLKGDLQITTGNGQQATPYELGV